MIYERSRKASLFCVEKMVTKKIFFQKTSLLGNIWHIKYRGMLATHIN